MTATRQTVGRATRSFGLLGIAVAIVASVAAVPRASATPPAPTITSGPSGSTLLTTATFTYSSKKSGVTFQCSLDNAAFTTCPSTGITYTSLTEGAHTFMVTAKLSDSPSSEPATRTWTVDTVAPAVSSISRSTPSPTNAASVSWAVTFSDSVGGVNAADFALARTGLTGSTTVTGVSGGPVSYVVTASTGGGVGTLRLDLADDDSIVDPAGHRLGGTGTGNGNFTGETYSIDRVAPAAPVFTEVPPDPSAFNEGTFAWTHAESDVSFECQLDHGGWQACSSPHDVEVSDENNKLHQFSVRAVDAAGNESPSANDSWKLTKIKFVITGEIVDADGDAAHLYPGTWRFIRITVTNPNSFDLDVESIHVAATSSPPGCAAATNLEFIQSSLSATNSVAMPRNSTVTFDLADGPQIRLKNLPTSQDACKNQSFDLAYTGMATK